MKFGITMVTYNRIKLLQECIGAIESQYYPVSEVIIVDNASTDGTKEYLDQLMNRDKKYIVSHLEENLGGSYGFYKALEIAKERDLDWLLIIDDDAIIAPNYLLEISKAIENNHYKAYSGTVYYNNIILHQHRKRINSQLFVTSKDVTDKEFEDESFLYDFSSFCGLVVKRELVNEIGLPIKDYFIKFDDAEYSLRIRKHTEIMNVNAAHLNHKITYAAAPKIRICDWKRYYEIRNNINMGLKYTSNKPIYVLYTIGKSVARIVQEIYRLFRYRNKYNSTYALPIFIKAPLDGLAGKTGKNMRYMP